MCEFTSETTPGKDALCEIWMTFENYVFVLQTTFDSVKAVNCLKRQKNMVWNEPMAPIFCSKKHLNETSWRDVVNDDFSLGHVTWKARRVYIQS